jgi:hypothetical protein
VSGLWCGCGDGVEMLELAIVVLRNGELVAGVVVVAAKATLE